MENLFATKIFANVEPGNPEGLRLYHKGDFHSEDSFDLAAETYHAPMNRIPRAKNPPIVTTDEDESNLSQFFDFL